MNANDEVAKEKLRKLRRWGIMVLTNTVRVMVTCMTLHLDVSAEKPGRSNGGRFCDEWAAVWDQLHVANVWGCAYGLRDATCGLLVEKFWKVCFTDKRFAETMARRCSSKLDGHEHVFGELNVKYPRDLCMGYAKFVVRKENMARDIVNMSMLALEVQTDDSVFLNGVTDDFKLPDNVAEKEAEQVSLRLQRIHRNSGHPANRVLAALLRRKGAKEWVQKMVLHIKRETCDQWARKPMQPVMDPTEPPQPLDSIAVDGLDWIHPVSRERARGTIYVDDGSAKTKTIIHKVAPEGSTVGNTSGEEA